MHGGEEVKKEGVNHKTVRVSFLMCVIVACLCCAFFLKHSKKDTVTEVTYDELPSGAVVNDKKGREAQLTLSDGSVLTFDIPDNMYNVRDDYLALVQTSYGTTEPVVSDNLIVLGDNNNVYTSKSAIKATTLNDKLNIFQQIYSGSDVENKLEDTYSPVYLFMTSGEVPETPYTNYKVTEQESVTAGDITYRVFVQEYDVVTTYPADGDVRLTEEEVTKTVKQMIAYSDSTDAVEIIVDAENNDMDEALKMFKTFLRV